MDELGASPGERMRSALKPFHIVTKILFAAGVLYLATAVIFFFIRINQYPLPQDQLQQQVSTLIGEIAYAAELIGFAAIVEFLRRIYQELRARKL
jgi:uncharacterized membrane protein